MDKTDLKKIIAREGLILLGVVLSSEAYGLWVRGGWTTDIFGKSMFGRTAVAVIVVLYCPYLLIRFIIWAIKTLREKK